MSKRSGCYNGNLFEYDTEIGEHLYVDTGESVFNGARPCPLCGKLPTEEGHDVCLGKLPGVKFACCGHGIEDGYISFENGVSIYFRLTDVIVDVDEDNIVCSESTITGEKTYVEKVV